LRKTEPDLARPFRTPFFPWIPLTALIIAGISLAVMAVYNQAVFYVFLGLVALAYGWYFLIIPKRLRVSQES
jgi:ethanolamine permease